ncbi:MAG: hypothetical protein OXQ94_17855 [Gemmatimonadota bacterium]|nr:hypothetical protein [Gemmatimonadota bacterium]MDE2873543.1 hypothetical protein [Gemmatimonadota bacterium]
MRHYTATRFRPLFLLSLPAIFTACGDQPSEPQPHGGPPGLLSVDDMLGTYHGTVQAAGEPGNAGYAGLTVEKAGDGIAGDLNVSAEWIQDGDTIILDIRSTYTGHLSLHGHPNLTLLLDNPVCGGTTRFEGSYSPASSSIEVAGWYVQRDADGCAKIATFDLTISVRKTADCESGPEPGLPRGIEDECEPA